MILGAKNSIMPIKNVSVLWKIYKQLFKRIFWSFSVIFVLVHFQRGFCAPSTHENPGPSFFLLISPLQCQKSCGESGASYNGGKL